LFYQTSRHLDLSIPTQASTDIDQLTCFFRINVDFQPFIDNSVIQKNQTFIECPIRANPNQYFTIKWYVFHNQWILKQEKLYNVKTEYITLDSTSIKKLKCVLVKNNTIILESIIQLSIDDEDNEDGDILFNYLLFAYILSLILIGYYKLKSKLI
jgi:hypothetical protein